MSTRPSLTALFLVIFLPIALSGQDLRQISEDEKLAIAAEVLGLPAERLGQVELAVQALPFTGRVITRVKAFDRVLGRAVGAEVDQDGRPVDPVAINARWRQVRRDHPEVKLHPDLVDAMRSQPGAALKIGLWLVFDGAEIDRLEAEIYAGIDFDTATRDEVRAAEQQIGALTITRAAEANARLLGELEGLGLAAGFVSTTAPVVILDVPSHLILALASLPEVETLYLATGEGGDGNDDANATHRTTRVHQLGVKGREVFACILENNTLDTAHPDLAITAPRIFNPGGRPTDDHVHATAGCLASNHPLRLGAAPDVDLFNAVCASYAPADIIAAADHISGTWVIDVTNMSFWHVSLNPAGVASPLLQLLDRYFEYQSRYFNDSYVSIAGNRGCGDKEVTSPGKAWNVITVGSFRDHGDGSWESDDMAGYSSYLDPAWQDRTFCSPGQPITNLCTLPGGGLAPITPLHNKPNLAANGDLVDTLGDSILSPGQPGPWLVDDYSGTSFAAPHVAGNLANAMVVNATIVGFAESAMALLMATAWHNIESGSVNSDVDGAGGLVGLAAFRCAEQGRVSGDIVSASSFTASAFGPSTFLKTIELKASDRARVCLAWSADVSTASPYSYPTGHGVDPTPHRPLADLDLYVYDPSGALMSSSTSEYDNYETVEFTPTMSGTYTVSVVDYRFDGALEAIGLAWSQRYADTSAVEIREKTPDMDETAPFTGPTIGTPAYLLDIFAPDQIAAARPAGLGPCGVLDPAVASSPQAYYCIPSMTPGVGYDLSGLYPPGSWMPIELDFLFDIWLLNLAGAYPFPVGWFGSAGITDPMGLAGQGMYLPPEPVAVGLQVHHVALVTDEGTFAPNGISERHTSTIWPFPTPTPLGEDGSAPIALPFGFEFFGATYMSCFVNANGNITFGGPDATKLGTPAAHLAGAPRIAFFWNDLSPHLMGAQGPAVTRTRLIGAGPSARLVIEFLNVPEFGGFGANTVRVTLMDGGRIKIEFRDCMPVSPVLVGISPGGGISAATELNIDHSGHHEGAPGEAIYEHFAGPGAGDGFDLPSPSEHWQQIEFVPNPTATAYELLIDLLRLP